jgi:hypothetical protein
VTEHNNVTFPGSGLRREISEARERPLTKLVTAAGGSNVDALDVARVRETPPGADGRSQVGELIKQELSTMKFYQGLSDNAIA